MDDRAVADIGEFGLIERLRGRLPAAENLLVGIGDDAAAFRTASPALASTDLLVEGVHFDFAFSSPADAGWKAIAVNVSDIAAMGGHARLALVALGMPAHTRVATIDAVYDGIAEACAAFGVSVAGGDTVEAPQVLLAVSVLGEPGPAGVRTRGGARPGDVLCVTGALGAAAAGLALLRLASHDPHASAILERRPALAAAHRRPVPRTGEAPTAAALASAMIDCSDGLAADAGHLAEASSCGLRLDADAVPIAGGVAEAAALLGVEPRRLAAGGGEDYELAIAVPEESFDRLAASIAPTPLTAVGRFLDPAEGRFAALGDERVSLHELGWRHFA